MTTPRPTPFPATTPRVRVFTSFVIIYDSDDESETAESLHTQTASKSVVYPPPTQSLPTSPVIASQPGKEISMPLGYKASM
nr:hypothetical protein [Tanacetum cinerariifolium]